MLKGAGSLIASADGRLALCDRGHPAMAGGGFGDVLAGLIGALRGPGFAGIRWRLAQLGVWYLHACAGERLARQGSRSGGQRFAAAGHSSIIAGAVCTVSES